MIGGRRGLGGVLLVVMVASALSGCVAPEDAEPGLEQQEPLGEGGDVELSPEANLAVVVESEAEPPVAEENATSLLVRISEVEMRTGEGDWVTLREEPVVVDLLAVAQGDGRVLVGGAQVDAEVVTQVRFTVEDAVLVTADGERRDLELTKRQVSISTDHLPVNGGLDSAVFLHFWVDEALQTETTRTFDPAGATVLVERGVDLAELANDESPDEVRTGSNATAGS